MRTLCTVCVALVLLSVSWKAVGGYLQTPEQNAPQLVIDSGGHTAPVMALAFTNDDKYLISAGRDKLVRVWDLKAGKTDRIIRGEIGRGQWGTINAADLTPNNRFLAVAGQLAADDDPGAIGSVRVHEFSDRASKGEVRAQLAGLPGVVTALDVSPKNTYVAAGDIFGNVCVWRLSPPAPTSSLVRCVRMHQDRITSLAFSPDEKKLAAGSWDKTLSISAIPAVQINALIKDHSDRVLSVAFHEDAVLSSSYDGTIRQWDPDKGRQVKLLYRTPDQILGNLAVDSQWRRMLFCSRGNFTVCEVVSLRTGNRISRFGKHTTITATALSHDGNTAATAGGSNNEIHVWRADSGAELWRLAGEGAEVTAVGFAKDGNSIAFASRRADVNANLLQQKITFNAPNRSAISLGDQVERQEDYWRELRSVKGTELQLRRNDVLDVVRSGKVTTSIRLEPGQGSFHSAYTLTPDGQFIISGGAGGFLARYDLSGNQIRRYLGHTGNITSLAMSADGKTLVSGSSDQLIRAWDQQAGNLLATFFVGTDDEWVGWIPDNCFVSSNRGSNYAGWQINNGLREPSWSPFKSYSSTYYCPERVAANLGRRAVRPGDQLAPVPVPQPQPVRRPPLVQISFADFQNADDLIIRAKATSPTDDIVDIRISANGSVIPVTLSRDNLLERTAEARSPKNEWMKFVREGAIRVEAEASTKFAHGAAAARDVTPPKTKTPEPDVPKARLFVLSIGISSYKDSKWNLKNPANDAQAFANLFAKQKGTSLYQDVIVRTLLNEKADRFQIIENLDWLRTAPLQGDVRILFLAGHGIVEADNYYFAGHTYNTGSIDNTSIHWLNIFDKFRGAAGKTLLIVDTCYSGGVFGTTGLTRGLRDRQDLQDMLNRFMQDTRSFFVTLAASTSREVVNDDSAFFRALMQGLSGEATHGNPAGNLKLVDVADLATFVTKRVSDTTKNEQHVIYRGLEDVHDWKLVLVP